MSRLLRQGSLLVRTQERQLPPRCCPWHPRVPLCGAGRCILHHLLTSFLVPSKLARSWWGPFTVEYRSRDRRQSEDCTLALEQFTQFGGGALPGSSSAPLRGRAKPAGPSPAHHVALGREGLLEPFSRQPAGGGTWVRLGDRLGALGSTYSWGAWL